jgi:hypothetical protein
MKFHPIIGHQGPRGLEGGGWSAPHPSHFTPGTHCTGGWVGLTASLDVYEKSRPHRDLIPRPSSMPYYDLDEFILPNSRQLFYCQICISVFPSCVHNRCAINHTVHTSLLSSQIWTIISPFLWNTDSPLSSVCLSPLCHM